MTAFLHGVEVVELDVGARPIATSKSSIIGLVGTAPMGPTNTPTLIAASRKEALAQFGVVSPGTTIPSALNAIFDQTGALVVVVNVSKYIPAAAADLTLAAGKVTLANSIVSEVMVGNISTDPTRNYELNVDYQLDTVNGTVSVIPGSSFASDVDGGITQVSISYNYLDTTAPTLPELKAGVEAIIGAESVVKVAPRLLIAPGFSHLHKELVDSMIAAADRLRAIAIADGPNTDDTEAITYREMFGSARLFMVDPHVKVYESVAEPEKMTPSSAHVAGVIAKSDQERGFWYSPSNRPILGISGTGRSIDFTLGDANARANILNENEVTTIIHQGGYRLWGNRSTSLDPKWAFISVRRTADLINDALLRSHLWAVDRNITRTYVQDVVAGVNSYLRNLISIGAILGGNCWADPELNTPSEVLKGKVYFDFDFTPPYPAEHITFRSIMVDNYISEVF
jgi:Bacteriophage tail sheath protein